MVDVNSALFLLFAAVFCISLILVLLLWRYKFAIPTLIGGTVLLGALIAASTVIVFALIDFNIVAIIIGASILTPIYLVMIVLLINRFQNPLTRLVDHAQKVQEKDFSFEIKRETRGDEFGIALNGFMNMVESLKLAIKKISSAAYELTGFAQELASSTEEVNASSEEISSIAQQMSRGAQEQTEQINNAVQRAEHLKNQFNQQVQGIDVTTDLISTINRQINMLALNANIEAARAGEYGRGFGVVAENIRRLADESIQAETQIGQIVKGLREVISKEIDEIRISIQSTASVSEENATGAEEASAATEEQAATLEEISAVSQTLAEIASNFESIVKQFKLQ